MLLILLRFILVFVVSLCWCVGGGDLLLEYRDMDATEVFEDIGHSEEAKDEMKKYVIGVLPKGYLGNVNSAQGSSCSVM